MKPIYLDNAATSWPKPPSVAKAITCFMEESGGNPGRAGHSLSIAAGRVVESARESVCELFGFDNPMGVVFGANATWALNMGIYARAYALAAMFVPRDSLIEGLYKLFSLERGVVLGAFFFLCGIVLDIRVAWRWIQSGFGFLCLTTDCSRMVCKRTTNPCILVTETGIRQDRGSTTTTVSIWRDTKVARRSLVASKVTLF